MRAALATAVAIAAIVGGGAVPASADTPGCVTRGEYRSVSKGMAKWRVASIFDTRGSRQVYSTSGGYSIEIRNYRTCLPYSVVSIAFENGRLSNKTAVWTYT